MVKSVVTFMQPESILRNVNIIFNGDQRNILIHCESNQLKQVLINLIKNAIEAMPDGGNVSVSLANEHGQVSIIIKDEGKGMPKETLEKFWLVEVIYIKLMELDESSHSDKNVQ
ncbi:ATP-binding protein [Bacillus sp. V5-8f]|uniref:ATP-binding protein n=1 Tax=Bacillus sp. V5-8f TaxID=2053044 RepID=UPI000C79318C|nr:sensor histidine kinase [Bacillus sp. V5-8f]PLT32831.1 hypothetical protein CUU64_16970 [Bacillus sp. V5-8f]